jgi:hypothetical protein
MPHLPRALKGTIRHHGRCFARIPPAGETQCDQGRFRLRRYRWGLRLRWEAYAPRRHAPPRYVPLELRLSSIAAQGSTGACKHATTTTFWEDGSWANATTIVRSARVSAKPAGFRDRPPIDPAPTPRLVESSSFVAMAHAATHYACPALPPGQPAGAPPHQTIRSRPMETPWP